MSSTVWWASMCQSPELSTSRSINECRAKAVKHVIEESDPGRDLGATGAVEVEADPDLRLRGLSFQTGSAGLAHDISSSFSMHCFGFEHGHQRVFEGLHLHRCTGRHPQPAFRSGLSNQNPAVEQGLPNRVPIGEPPEEDEVGV